MFKKKKTEPIRFGRTDKKVPEPSVVSIPSPAPATAPIQQPVSVVIQNGGGEPRVGRRSVLFGAVDISGRVMSKLWRLILDLVGLAFIVLVIWGVAGLLQSAGVINLPFLEPLSKFFQDHFLKLFHFVVPAGTAT